MGLVQDRLDVEAADGARLPVHRWRPEGARTSIVLLHGATSHGGWFATLAEALGKRGIATYAPDRRGSGLVRDLGLPDVPSVWVEDLRRIVERVKADGGDVVLAPWCFAAKLAVPALAAGAPADRLLFVTPAFYFSKDVGGGFQKSLARGDEFPVPAPDDAFVSAPHSLAFMAADPLRWRAMTRKFTELSKTLLDETRAALPKIAAPMSAVFARGDRIVDNELGQQLTAEHRIPTQVIDGSHGFFLDDPERAAEILAPQLAGN